MIVSINQPAYLPWLGYFHRIAVSDLHVVLDSVQFEKYSFTNRYRVRTREGSTWLTVPVRTGGRFGDLVIRDIEVADDPRWAAKHWATLQASYRKAPHFAEHAPFFEDTYRRPWSRLADVAAHVTAYLLDAFGITTPLVRSSDLAVTGAKDELVLNLCTATGATTYLSGPLGRDYLRTELFDAAGIEVAFHDYRHPEYPQAHPGFEPYMAAVDLLFNCGARSLDVLCAGQPAVVVQ